MEADLSRLDSSETTELNSEWTLLVECARPAVDAERLQKSLRYSVNWPALFDLAEEHGVLGLLATRLREFGGAAVPSAIALELRERYRAQVLFTLRLAAEMFRLFACFAEAGLEVMATKGPALSVLCYEDPGLRYYGDLDFIVRDKDILRSTKLMIGLGYEPRVSPAAILEKKSPGEYAFRHPNTKLLVEFHSERTFRYHPRPLPVASLFKRQARVKIDAHDIPTLSPEDELILICIHGGKHCWEQLSYIADVAKLVSKVQLDWEQVRSAAEVVCAQRMLLVGLRLSNELLGAPLPENIAAAVRKDWAVAKLATQTMRWLPSAGFATPGIFERAIFRMRMRGGILSGLIYLARLSFSPTEEDWIEGAGKTRHWLLDTLRRPFRLARKYGRPGKT